MAICQLERNESGTLQAQFQVLVNDCVQATQRYSSQVLDPCQCHSWVSIYDSFHSLNAGLTPGRFGSGCSLQVHQCCSPICERIVPESDTCKTQTVLRKNQLQSIPCCLKRQPDLHTKMDVNPLNQLRSEFCHTLHVVDVSLQKTNTKRT